MIIETKPKIEELHNTLKPLLKRIKKNKVNNILKLIKKHNDK